MIVHEHGDDLGHGRLLADHLMQMILDHRTHDVPCHHGDTTNEQQFDPFLIDRRGPVLRRLQSKLKIRKAHGGDGARGVHRDGIECFVRRPGDCVVRHRQSQWLGKS